MFELSIWSRWRVVNHPIPPSLPLALKLIHELIHGCDTSPSLLSLSLSIYTEPAASFLIRLHREEAGRCLLLSKDSSTTSSLPGLAPPPPSPFGQTCPTSPAKWPKGTVPGSCRPSFRLNRATNFFVAKPFVSPPPSVKEARIPPPPRCLAAVPPGWAPAAVAIVVVVFGPKNFRAMENNRIHRQICLLPSNFLTFLPHPPRKLTSRPPWRTRGRRVAARLQPETGRRACLADIARGVRPFSLTPWWGWIREIQENLGFLCQGDSLSEIGSVWCGWSARIFISNYSVTNWILILQDFKFESSMNNNLHGARSC